MRKGKKQTNTFKFQNFSERISSINIDIHRKASVLVHEIPDEDKDTFFRETLNKLQEVHCSIDFTKLYHKLRPLVQSFNQLIFHKSEIIGILKEYLCKEESLALEPCLELLSHLAKDLLNDFYVHFEEFFPLLMEFLKTQNTALIEQTFICFAHIFKHIWRCMVEDLENVFKLFSCLFSLNQKLHIRIFAAEAFAFLIRKTRDKEKTIQFLLEQVNEDLAHGIGHLLFQTIKGITGRLSLNAEEILKLTLKLVTKLSSFEVSITLQAMWFSALKYTDKDHSSVLISSVLHAIQTESCPSNTQNSGVLNCYLMLLETILTFKYGSYVTDHRSILKVLSSHLKVRVCDKESTDALQKVISELITCHTCSLLDDEIVTFLNDYLSHKDVSLGEKVHFFKLFFQWIKFDDVLKPLVFLHLSGYLLEKKCSKDIDTYNFQKETIFQFLVDIVYMKGSHSLYQPFEIGISANFEFPVLPKCKDSLENVLVKELSFETFVEQTDWFWVVIVTLVNTKLKETRKVLSCLGALLSKALNQENLEENKTITSFYLFVLSHTISCYLTLSYQCNKRQQPKNLTSTIMMNLLRKFPSDENILKCFELYVSIMSNKESIFDEKDRISVYDIVKGNLSSPFKLKRLATLMILNHFSGGLSSTEKDQQALENCIKAENIDVDLDTYRNRMLHIQKLTGDAGQYSPLFSDLILRYLIGNLYINFNVIWEPTIKVIVTHASLTNEVFWDIWKDLINSAAILCREIGNELEDIETTEESMNTCEEMHYSKKYFNFMTTFNKNQRPDYFNFRNLLWTAMTYFPKMVERKSKDVVPVFLEFIEKEFISIDQHLLRTQDLTVKKIQNYTRSTHNIDVKTKVKSLCAHLKVFALFKNPRSLSKEKLLYEMHLNFLANRENEVQVLALGCLQTYNFPYLKPYKENLEKLMDDSSFREELLKFSSANSDTGVLQEDHKTNIMPILIRLLYGKLQRRAGLGMSGKSGSSTRRNIIMHFLANCSTDEIKTFVDLMLQPLKGLEDLNILDKASKVDVTSVVPLQRQSGYCNMLSHVISRLGTLILPYLSTLLSTLLKIIWTSSWCLVNKSDQINDHVTRLKEIRRNGIFKLIEMFTSMPAFQFEHQIEEIFTAAVWPKLKLLSLESCQNITPLFHLIMCWSKNNRFLPLLCKEDGHANTILACMFNILQQKSISAEVEKQIMTVSLNFLTLQNHVEDGSNGSTIQAAQCFNEEETVGVQLIKPFVHKLLQYLYKNLSAKTDKLQLKTKHKIWSIIPNVQLDVLANISNFVTDKEQCQKILMILFPVLRCMATEDVQTYIMTTINNLLLHVMDSHEHLPLIPQLFVTFRARKPRDLLCRLYIRMTTFDTDLSTIAHLVANMNSWDEKRLDEPDYEKRITAYRDITNQVKEKQWSLNHLLPVIHNCFFFVDTTTDMSIRDAASGVIETIIKTMLDEEGFGKLVSDVILPSLRHGLKSKNEITRYEFVQMLALLVKSTDRHSCKDLRVLCSDDPETDFFENIRHVQSHRRTRALQQLNKLCEEKSFTVNSLFSILLPLVSHAIFSNLSHTKDHNLLSETIAVIGTIVKCLPWVKYSHVLHNYLTLLPKEKKNQKTIIRVVVSLLNNFSFDLSSVDPICAPKTGREKKVKNLNAKLNNINQLKGAEQNFEHQMVMDKNDNGKQVTTDDVIGDDLEEPLTEGTRSAKNLERIYISLTTKLLPQLKRYFLKKSSKESFHKLSKNRDDDDEEMMKVPVAVAIVKMLQHLPQEALKTNLSGLILRVSQALKSQARDVREVARDTIKKIVLSLGTSYLHPIIKDMKSVLLRGYQLHVLGFTVHSMLECIEDQLKPGDLDTSLEMLMEIIVEELFGTVSEEKDVQKIAVKLHEAKSKKSNELIEIIAKNVSSIGQLISPLKEILDSTHDHKVRRKVEEALRCVGMGLQNNKDVSGEDLLIFIHGVVSCSTSGVLEKNDPEKTNEDDTKYQEDIFILPEEPIRGGKKPEASKQTNEHILVEFAIQLLHTGLKRQKYVFSNPVHVRMLDPFVKVILSSMCSTHSRIVTLTMRCLALMVRFPLPTLKHVMPKLAKNLFKVIKKYGRSGAGQGDNFEMIFSAFKAMTVIIREYKEMKVTNKQLEVLLSYVEEDIHDTTRRSTALPLMKAILSRKLSVPIIVDVMEKICELSIRNDDDVIRIQCRQLMLIYMLDYPLGKKLKKLFDFYVSQLSYEEETGRTSVLELLAAIFNAFPAHVLVEHAGYFFIPLVMMLVNDESALCRKMAAAAVKLLLVKTDADTRNELFDIVLSWSNHEKMLLKEVSMQLFGMFIEVEVVDVEKRLDVMNTIMLNVITDGVSSLEHEDDDDDESDSEEDTPKKKHSKTTDKLLYNCLTCLGKLFSKANVILCNDKYIDQVHQYLTLIPDLLLHPHAWVRLSASQLFAFYFAVNSPVDANNATGTYFSKDTNAKVKDLCYIFYDQLKDDQLSQDIAEQATKNLIYLSKMVKSIDPAFKSPAVDTEDENDDAEEEDTPKTITMRTFIAKMCQLATFEATHSPKQTIKRTSVFRWIAALCIDLTPEQLLPYLTGLLRPINRNITTSKDQDGDLYKLAQEVLELIRSHVDKQTFAEVYAKLQKKVLQTKESRKRKLAIEAVADPQKFALRKQKINVAKREQKKRKLYEQKPILKFKKIRSKPED